MYNQIRLRAVRRLSVARPRRRLLMLAVPAITLIPAVLMSQGVSGSDTPFAVISGTAVDSLRGGYLRGAIVQVTGTSRSAVTDSAGRFRIDSIPPGSHQLEMIHPLLDTLGMSLKTPAMPMKAGDNGRIILAIPSAATVISAKCSPAERARGPAAMVGMVLEADTDNPAAGANVSLDWVDIEATGKTFRKTPRLRSARVQDDGSFRICGLPADFSANALAARAGDSTSLVGVQFAPLLAVVTLFLPPPDASSTATAPSSSGLSPETAPRGKASLSGRILSKDGAPVARARVAMDSEGQVAVSGADGTFRVEGIRPGTRTLTVRALGFQPTEVVVAVTSRNAASVVVNLDKFVPVLEDVRISAVRAAALDRVGFAERKARGGGKFFSPEDIATRNPLKLNQLLESASMLRSGVAADGRRYITGRFNGCVRYVVDGMRWLGPDDIDSTPDNFLSGAELGAVEAYDAISAPAEYAITAKGSCSVVLIWTKFKLRT